MIAEKRVSSVKLFKLRYSTPNTVLVVFIVLVIMISKTIFLGISEKTKMNEVSSRHFGKIKTAQDVVSHNHSLSGLN